VLAEKEDRKPILFPIDYKNNSAINLTKNVKYSTFISVQH
jgi:hypothetical protein